SAVTTLVPGLLVLVWPEATLHVLAVLVGLYLLVTGSFRFVAVFAREGHERLPGLLLAVLYVLAGVLCLRNPLQTIAALSLIVGVVWLVSGLLTLYTAIAAEELPHRGVVAVVAVLGIVAGIVVLALPAESARALTRLLGLWLVLLGLAEAAVALAWRAALRRAVPSMPSSSSSPSAPAAWRRGAGGGDLCAAVTAPPHGGMGPPAVLPPRPRGLTRPGSGHPAPAVPTLRTARGGRPGGRPWTEERDERADDVPRVRLPPAERLLEHAPVLPVDHVVRPALPRRRRHLPRRRPERLGEGGLAGVHHPAAVPRRVRLRGRPREEHGPPGDEAGAHAAGGVRRLHQAVRRRWPDQQRGRTGEAVRDPLPR